MKKLIVVMLLLPMLSGCVSIMLDLSSRKVHPSKQDNRCIELKQPVELWQGSKIHMFQKNFLKVNNDASAQIVMAHGKVDVISPGTKFRVNKIYERYIHASPAGWFLRVDLLFLNGQYQGETTEISGAGWPHPRPWLYSYDDQGESVDESEDLNANSLEFNQEYFKYCDDR